MFIGLIQRYGLETEVAKHLSDNYGDRAWTVCDLAEPTGKAWPLYGVRLSTLYPFIEAEVRYAVRHEYAQTAVDVISRRLRIAFLNAQAALDSLPRVVEIMSDELHWDAKRQKAEMEKGVEFLGSMGLRKGALPRGSMSNASLSTAKILGLNTEGAGWIEKVEGLIGLGRLKEKRSEAREMFYTRAQFVAGEVEMLRQAFLTASHPSSPSIPTTSASTSPSTAQEPSGPGSEGHMRMTVPKVELFQLVKSLPGFGFGGIKNKDFNYVLEEVGYQGRGDVDFDEFVEICGQLREVLFAPPLAKESSKAERRRIPVGRSGGGV